MLEVIQFIFSDFWVWVGCVILLVIVLQFFTNVWCRFVRTIKVLCRGWPPSHLDADGDWKSQAEEKSND